MLKVWNQPCLKPQKQFYSLLLKGISDGLLSVLCVEQNEPELPTMESNPNRHFTSLWCKIRSLWESKMTLKMLPASWYLLYLFKGFRSFNIVNMGSVGQRASKLLAVKVGGLKKKSAIWPRPLSNQSARIRVVPGSNHSQSLMAGHFAALWPTDPKFSALKDLNSFKKL